MDKLVIYAFLLSTLTKDGIYGEILKESCNKECLVAPHLNCYVHQDAACHSDSYFPTDGLWSSRPATFDASVSLGSHPSLSWRLLGDASFHIINGFLLEITQLATLETKCVHINLTGTVWQPSDKQLTFNFSCLHHLETEGSYYLKLHPLPLPKRNMSKEKWRDLYFSYKTVDKDRSTEWMSVIKFYVVSSDKFSGIRAYFVPAPPTPGFTDYTLALSDPAGNTVKKEVSYSNIEGQTKEINFENVCPGTYKLIVYLCICNGELNCKDCPSVSTSPFHVNATLFNSGNLCDVSTTFSSVDTLPSPTGQSGSKPSNIQETNPDLSDSNTVIITVAVFSCVILVFSIVLGICAFIKRNRGEVEEPPNNQMDPDDYAGKEEIWNDFMNGPQPSVNFEDYPSADIKYMNHSVSEMVQPDSGFSETQSFKEESGYA